MSILAIQGILVLFFLACELVRVWQGVAYYDSPFSDIRGICALSFVFIWLIAVATALVKYALGQPPKTWWVLVESAIGAVVLIFVFGMTRLVLGG